MSAEQTLDNQIKIMLQGAGILPKAPEMLVGSTAQRMKLIEAGRKAEKSLREMDAGHMAREDPRTLRTLSYLAAEGVVGRLACRRDLVSEGYRAEDTAKLASDQRMQDAIRNRSPAEIGEKIANGSLAAQLGKREMGSKARAEKERRMSEAQKAKQNQKPMPHQPNR